MKRDVMEHLGHFDSIVPSLACSLTKQQGVRGGKIPLENSWKWHFWDSKIQNVPRCLGLQKLVPLVQVPKPTTIHYQPATRKLFDSPAWPLWVFPQVKRGIDWRKIGILAISRIVLNRCVHIVKEVIPWNLSLWLLEQSKEVTLWVNLSWHIRSYI